MRESQATQFAISVAVLMLVASGLSGAQDPGGTHLSVTTWQDDTHRTGQNLNEATLTYGNLNTTKNPTFDFGQLCSVQLDGQVYAQPLVVTNSKINGVMYPWVVYVVTENDTLYAINGTPPAAGGPCGPIASLPFLTTGATNGHSAALCGEIGSKNCGTVAPVVGILGTPWSVLRTTPPRCM